MGRGRQRGSIKKRERELARRLRREDEERQNKDRKARRQQAQVRERSMVE